MTWLRETKSWLWLAAIVALLIIVVFVVGRCSQNDRLRDARNAQTQAEGRTVSATEAINEIGNLNKRGAVTDAQTQEAINAVRQADPSDRDAVARRELCRLQQRTNCDGMQ